MKGQIFREKSIRQISSPEELNDYVRSAGPGVWLCLAAVLVLLAGVCVWGVFGRLDTTLSVPVIVENGEAVCLIPEAEAGRVEAGMPLSVGEKDAALGPLSERPGLLSQGTDPYLLHAAGLEAGEWVYTAALGKLDLEDGVYQGTLTLESVAPMSFVVN